MQKPLFLLPAALCLLPAGLAAQAPEAAAPREGALNSYLTREPDDVKGQLALMLQGMYEQQLDVTVVQFQLQYGSRVHMDRTYFPASTSDHEMIPGYFFT